MADIQLTAAMRANLLSLQSTAQLLGVTQQRLASGRKVNSATDNAAAFFSAKLGFQKSDDLSALKNDMGEALQKIQTAVSALDSVDSVLQQMKGLIQQAKATSDATTRGNLATQFDALNTQLGQLITNDANYKGTNLLDGQVTGNDLVVTFNETATSSITIAATDTSGTSYAVVNSASSWGANTDIATAETDVNAAVTAFRDLSRSLASNSTYIQTRVDFTNQLVNLFKTGAENLVSADLNEEGANLLALQTRQQLGISALGLSAQANQSILRLFP